MTRRGGGGGGGYKGDIPRGKSSWGEWPGEEKLGWNSSGGKWPWEGEVACSLCITTDCT